MTGVQTCAVFCDKSETTKTSPFALVVLTTGLLCVGNAVGQDEKKAESDVDVVAFEATLAKAKAGDTVAMALLGIMYDNGEGVIEDDVEAYAWFNVAAAKGQKMVAEKRDNIKKSMTPEQIAEGQKRSREIMKSIAKE